MQQAYADARQSFKYFWRELSWEARRIVPGLDMSMVKIPFSDGPRTDGRPQNEHMWIGDVEYDGDTISGTLLNSPNWLTSVREGDAVRVPFSHLTDWMMTADGRAYGGFTVNLMRARMDRKERKQHDDAWGLEFGDPAVVQVEVERGKSKGKFLSGLFGSKPKNSDGEGGFKEHPMCLNMLEKYDAQLKGDPSPVEFVDETGLTLLHRDALAGNFALIKLYVQYGADVAKTTPSGRTAADLARGIGWPEIAEYLDSQKKA